MPKGMHKEFADVIQAIADKQGEVAPESIYSKFEEEYLTAKEPFELIHYEVTDIGMDTKALVRFKYKGEQMEAECVGNGPIDAVKAAVLSKVPLAAKVLDYDEHALTQGSKSKAAAYIHMVDLDTGHATYGVGISSNITRASIRGIFSAFNRLYGKKD
jgi:2-isopropylmalate synthase